VVLIKALDNQTITGGQMKFQIKSLAGELEEEKKKYLRKKVLWLEKHLPEASHLTIGVKQHITKKSNQAFEVIFHLILQGVKRPIYVRVYEDSFDNAVDKAEEKVERSVVKIKEKGSRFRFKLPSIPKLPRISFRKAK